MEQDLVNEWVLFTNEATKLVRRGCALRGLNQVFRLSTLPSFTNPETWELFQSDQEARVVPAGEAEPPDSDSAYCVALLIWRMDLDYKKFESPTERLRFPGKLTPTMERQVWNINAGKARMAIDLFSGLSIPVFSRRHCIGCDGTTYEFSFGDFFLRTAMSWWEQAPIEWRPLEEAFHATMRDFKNLPEHDRVTS